MVFSKNSWLNIMGETVEELADVAESKTGKRNGWMFKALFACWLAVGVLPWILAFGKWFPEAE